jgi:protein involved in polysaccharide export with SLBB domain
MKKYLKTIASFLILNITLLSCPIWAIDISQLGINIPNVQNVDVTEKITPQATLSTVLESPIDENSYRIGPGDLLIVHIIVGNSELNIDRSLLVGADGKVFFPNVGEIYLAGLSLAKAKEKIKASISRVYQAQFELSVLLAAPKQVKIYLSGMFKKPGPIIVADNSRLSEVIGQAGGAISGASNRYVYVHRKDSAGKEVVLSTDLFEAFRGQDLSKDIRIQSGDIIEIPDAANELVSNIKVADNDEKDKLLFVGKESFVYIYGEVGRSGRFEYIPGKRLSDYISFAGGPNQMAVLSGVTVTRQVNGQPKKYTVNMNDVLYNGKANNDLEIYGGDVINVPKNFFYVPDFTSLANTIMLAVALYAAIRNTR